MSDKTQVITVNKDYAPLMFILVLVMLIGNLVGAWSIPWLWVFAPVWLPFALAGVALAVFFILFIFAGILMAIFTYIDTRK